MVSLSPGRDSRLSKNDRSVSSRGASSVPGRKGGGYELSIGESKLLYQQSRTQRYIEMQAYLDKKSKDSPTINYDVVGLRHQDEMSEYEKQVPRFSTSSPYDNFRYRNTEIQASKPRMIYVGKPDDSYEKLKKKKYSSEESRMSYESEMNMTYKPGVSSNRVTYN